MRRDKLKICFVCWQAYPAYVPAFKAPIGGAEFRSSRIAKELAKNEQFEVSALVANHPVVGAITVDGVQVVPLSDRLDFLQNNLTITGAMVQRVSGFPWIKLCHTGLSLLWRLPLAIPFQLYKYRFDTNSRPARIRQSYIRHQADIFLCFCKSNQNADMIITTQKVGRKSILMIASDTDIDKRDTLKSDESTGTGESDIAWYQAIMAADAIVTQTVYQQQLLKERFGRDSHVVYNPIDLEHHLETRYPDIPLRYVLWVGCSDIGKRPELCLELAHLNPKMSFVMVMNKVNLQIHESIVSNAPANVTIIEQVPVDQIESLYCHAAVYLSTSRAEGFPNTFLQAAKYQVPVASLTVDPNNMLTTHGGGVWAQDDLDILSKSLQKIWCDDAYRNSLGENALAYVKKHHNLPRIIDQIESIITELAVR